MSDDIETHLEVNSDASKADPHLVAEVLRGVAEALEDAPDNRQYDFELDIDEHTVE